MIGATINTTGSLRVRAEKVGADTMLAQIIKLVQQAQASKAPIQRLADVVSGFFVPAVIAIACGEDDIARLREAGFTDADILHIAEVTAIFNYNVRLACATGLFPNAGYHQLGRTARTEG